MRCILEPTIGEALDSQYKAIEAATSAESYKINGREKVNANLSVLYRERDRLIKLVGKYGRDIKESQIPRRRGPVFKKAVW